MWERKGMRKRHMEAKIPKERLDSEEDLKALHRAGKVKSDPGRHAKVKALAKEKLDEGRRRGKYQANVTRKDNTV